MSGRMDRIGGPTIAGLAASALVAAVSIGVWAILPGDGHAACQTDTVGVDTSLATDQYTFVLGDAIGQIVVAPETLISSITFWRSAYIDTGYTGLHLYIVGTDSLGRPNTADVIANGPTVYNYYGSLGRPTPFRFEFNPPLALPRRGKYEVAMQSDPCDWVFYFIYSRKDVYPDGEVWWHDQTALSGYRLRINPEEFPAWDLVFQIEFCGPMTPTLPSTWGAVKDRYRR